MNKTTRTKKIAILQSRKVLGQVASGGKDQSHEGRGGLQGTSQQLGVVLDTNKVGMISQLNNLHTLTSLVLANELQSLGLKLSDHLGVHLITMAMAFQDG